MNTEKPWADLSLNAKNIIEWVSNPHNEFMHEITIAVGEYPKLDGKPRKLIDHPVDQVLLDEIVDWTSSDPEMTVSPGADGTFTFFLAAKLENAPAGASL